MMTWIAAAMSLLGVLTGATLQYAFNQRIEARKVLAAQKALAYTDFFKAVAGLAQERSGELLALAANAKTRICLFEATEVIQSLIDFEREGAVASSTAGQHALLSLLNVMRQDLLGSETPIAEEKITALLFGAQRSSL